MAGSGLDGHARRFGRPRVYRSLRAVRFCVFVSRTQPHTSPISAPDRVTRKAKVPKTTKMRLASGVYVKPPASVTVGTPVVCSARLAGDETTPQPYLGRGRDHPGHVGDSRWLRRRGRRPAPSSTTSPRGDYPVEVLAADFAAKQTIAETYDLKLAVRNSGDETIPAMAVTINLPGEGSTLAFDYRDDQVGLARPQRPVWVLEEGYPKLAGTVGRGGAGTANKRTFNFGEVKAGDSRRDDLAGRRGQAGRPQDLVPGERRTERRSQRARCIR